ncbi:MAG: class I tRNA ligase family protein [Magnetococcales bacterium]|nr:class I tRNA ligase family protein [Magnetococcales bacterium]
MYRKTQKYPNFVQIEQDMLVFWKNGQIFQKLKDQNSQGEIWSFQDGPITANNPMGVHHAWGRTLKDIFQRYHAMMGRRLRYQNGFDCQGLWVEVEIEKEHGFASKKDIKAFGIERFISACKERVLTFAAKQTEQSIRLGYWMDWDDPDQLRLLRDALRSGAQQVTYTAANGKTVTASPESIIAALGTPEFGGSYFTFSNENNYTIWSFLKKCHEDGHIYRGTDVMPWCPRCGTGLSQMELADGRKIVEHDAIYVRFPLRDHPDEAFLVWTTTPWTLTANVAVAINPEMTYVKVRHKDWIYYVGKENLHTKRHQLLETEGVKQQAKLPSLAQLLQGQGGHVEILGEIPGNQLLGIAYHGPLDDLEALNTPGGVTPFGPAKWSEQTATMAHRAIAWKEITSNEGTGIVHIAPGCGKEDYDLGRENHLPVVAPLDENGIFQDKFGPYVNLPVKIANQNVITALKESGRLVAKERYPHVYPHCWRCKTELVYRLIDGWYIDMSWRDQIQAVVGSVRWIPGDGEAREQDWLRNMGDWLISKKRFWGLALPIWECSCGWFTVIGGYEELAAKAVAGWEAFQGHSPHRPYIDQVKIACEACGGHAHRVEDVGNPWLDAGIVPFSTLNYRRDPENWQKFFPANMVIECFPGQFRNWFYSLLAMSVKLDGRAPFRTLLGHALVRDERGEEMHKSAGNSILFDEAADVLGAEVMRYLYASQNPSVNLNFPDLKHKDSPVTHTDAEARRKLLVFWNCYSFFVSYATLDGWTPSPEDPPPAQREQLDRWILSRLQGLVRQAHEMFEAVTVYRLVAHFEAFVEDLSNWYLRRSRRRIWGNGLNPDKRATYATLHETLVTCLELLAPILPFFTEEIYQNLVCSVDPNAPESIHLRPYPRVDVALVDERLEQSIDIAIRMKNMVLNLRNECQIKVRQPLNHMAIFTNVSSERAVLGDPDLQMQILEECNIKTIEILESADQTGIRITVVPNYKTLGPKTGSAMPRAAEAIARLDAMAVYWKVTVERGTWPLPMPDGTAIELTATDLKFTFDAGQGRIAVWDGGVLVVLDIVITPELADEGLSRDFNRLAQNMRRDIGLDMSDRVVIVFDGPAGVVDAVRVHDDYLRGELLAEEIRHQPGLSAPTTAPLAGGKVTLLIKKVVA